MLPANTSSGRTDVRPAADRRRDPDTVVVDASRLAPGRSRANSDRLASEGDIHAAYSADRMPYGRVRRPFRWRNGPWVTTSYRWRRGQASAEAYRIVPRAAFNGTALTCRDKSMDADAAHGDPNGYWHGLLVRYQQQEWVLAGPPVRFVAGESEQRGLF